eukprot:TRINITY_DN8463_c0_g1_i2.p1 TRINITY_DN8463_c0_g1~~TRINITY_DN8463_c0_g1_i2.p1  ORF type:complete len:886 (+),score=218.19 TRINITY_DN8463_c0_g1_i2:44-2701(+)
MVQSSAATPVSGAGRTLLLGCAASAAGGTLVVLQMLGPSSASCFSSLPSSSRPPKAALLSQVEAEEEADAGNVHLRLRGGVRIQSVAGNAQHAWIGGLLAGAAGCAVGAAVAAGRQSPQRQAVQSRQRRGSAVAVEAAAWGCSQSACSYQRQRQQQQHSRGTASSSSSPSSSSSSSGARRVALGSGAGEVEALSQLAAEASNLSASAATAVSMLATAGGAEATAAATGAGSLPEAVADAAAQLLSLLGPVQPAMAFEEGSPDSALSRIQNFFFDPRLQWDENGNVLLDPQGNPLPDNLWTQFVACQATLIKRLDEAISGVGVPQSFGFAVATYTLMIRAFLYPFIKGQLEVTAKIQVLAPRVNELKEKYKDDEERLQQEVGLLYMDLQVDPLGAILPLLLQLPVFWGLYRGIRRLAIVEYPHLKEGFLWIPSLYGPNFKPDPSFDWITQWQGPLISLHPKIGWTDFALYAIMPVSIFFTYRQVLGEALADENAPKLLQFTPFLLSFITIELPQAMGIYIATNIASSVALTSYTKAQISAKIPGYEEFVKTGEWPPGVDPEKVMMEAFGVKRLTSAEESVEDPLSVPEAVFSGRADFIPTLLEKGRSIDEFDDRGIPACAYTLALNNAPLLQRLWSLGSDPRVLDKRGNTLLHYCAGYGRHKFLPMLLEKDLKDLLNITNEDGQSPVDVARVNLSQAKVADECRMVLAKLVEAGAEGKLTTLEDEAKYEEMREQKQRDEQVKQARSALKALAMAAQKEKDADAGAEGAAKEPKAAAKNLDKEVEPEGPRLDPRVAAPLQDSLERVRRWDIGALKERLGGKLSEEQLKKLSERLATMSPEELAQYAAGLKLAPSKDEKQTLPSLGKANPEEQPTAPPEQRKESVIVD